MGLAALIIALVLHANPVQHRQKVDTRPVWPAQGTITSPFGHTEGRWHPGLDIGLLRSLDVVAAVPGRIELVGEPTGYEGYGNVVVEQSAGYQEVYAHLSAWDVKPGEVVRPGERIATAGCTGDCTGTHLHFEVRREGAAVSPLTTVLRPLFAPPPVAHVVVRAQPVYRIEKPLY